jgi:hypothetical protein
LLVGFLLGSIGATVPSVAGDEPRAEPSEDPASEEPATAAAEGDDEATSETPNAKPTRKERFHNGVRHTLADAKYLVTFPARPTRKGVITASAVVGGVVVLYLLDDQIRDQVQENPNDNLDLFEPLGNGQVTAFGSLGVYLGGKLSGSEEVTETGRALIESVFFTQLFTMTFKGLTGRDGPSDSADADDFFGGGSAFPSGHTSRAFAIATVLAERYGKIAAWIAYPLATLVGLQRIQSDVHWASDVLAGAALGWGVGKAVVRLRAARADAERKITFAPTFGPQGRGAGIMVRLTF